jgi:hypothetical protein
MAITCYLFPKTMLATSIPEGNTTNQISHTTKTQIFGPYACDLGTWTGLAKRTDLEGLHQRSSSRPRLDRRRRPAAARWGQHLCGAMQELGSSAMGCRGAAQERRPGGEATDKPGGEAAHEPGGKESDGVAGMLDQRGGRETEGAPWIPRGWLRCGGARLLPTEAPGWGKPEACDGGARSNQIS